MKNIPNKIYLNIDDADGDFNDLIDVTWSDSRINDSDVEYILNDQQSKSDKRRLNIDDVNGDLHIEFAMYLCGYSREDTEQMFNDWQQFQ